MFFLGILFAQGTVSLTAGNYKEEKKEAIHFVNQEKLDSIFEHLYQLEQNKSGKINIVHLGDSHIQADFFTNAIRTPLQEKFGDGGLGFSFPYSLVSTNGTKAVKYVSDANWNSRLNVAPTSPNVEIGLSGIGLYTTDTVFSLQLNMVDKTFNTIKVLYSTETLQYDLSVTASDSIKYVKTNVSQQGTRYRIKSGDNLSKIAARHKITVAALKRENNLRSDRIQAGKYLKIPAKKTSQTIKQVTRGKFDLLPVENYLYSSSYTSVDSLNKITILSKSGFKNYDLSGMILENNKPGIIYHTIGVNGAKVADFNKLPLFFDQLRVISPDLVILSFGTNESFQKLAPDQFAYNLRELISRIRKYNKNATVLIMTPPPSLMRRRNSNPLVKEYQKVLTELTDITVWDLFSRLGGEKGIRVKGKYANIIARDKIHYTQDGYQQQGEMFVNDFLDAYNKYKKEKKQN